MKFSFKTRNFVLKTRIFLLKWWNLQVHGELTPRFDEITAQVTWKMIDFFVEKWWFSIEIWWFSIEVWWFYNNQQAKNIIHDLADQRLGWRGLRHGDTRVDNFCAIFLFLSWFTIEVSWIYNQNKDFPDGEDYAGVIDFQVWFWIMKIYKWHLYHEICIITYIVWCGFIYFIYTHISFIYHEIFIHLYENYDLQYKTKILPFRMMILGRPGQRNPHRAAWPGMIQGDTSHTDNTWPCASYTMRWRLIGKEKV